MQALDAALPDDALLVYGVGHFWSFAVMHLHRPAPADHLHAYGFGAVGHGLPTAIGAAVAPTGRSCSSRATAACSCTSASSRPS